jgi:hypothetical protein
MIIKLLVPKRIVAYRFWKKLTEIGEINDHIQAEAGHNIIMGVGEENH